MNTPNTDHRTAPRYAVDAAVHGQIGEQPFEARLQDVSATGAAVVGMGGVGYENNAFVQLHMDGIATSVAPSPKVLRSSSSTKTKNNKKSLRPWRGFAPSAHRTVWRIGV